MGAGRHRLPEPRPVGARPVGDPRRAGAGVGAPRGSGSLQREVGPAVGTARLLSALWCTRRGCHPTASATPEPALDREKTISPSVHNAETLAGQLEGSGWQIPDFWS